MGGTMVLGMGVRGTLGGGALLGSRAWWNVGQLPKGGKLLVANVSERGCRCRIFECSDEVRGCYIRESHYAG